MVPFNTYNMTSFEPDKLTDSFGGKTNRRESRFPTCFRDKQKQRL